MLNEACAKTANRILVIGGGVNGLSTAFFHGRLHPADCVHVVEACDRVGGWMRTDRWTNESIRERGPRSLRVDRDLLAILVELDLLPQIISPDSHAQRRFVWWNQSLTPTPSSPWQALKSPLTRTMLPRIARDYISPPLQTRPPSDGDESIASFVERHFGKNARHRLADPLVAGIFAGRINALSLRSCFPALWHADQMHGGSVVRAMLHGKPNEYTASWPRRDCDALLQQQVDQWLISRQKDNQAITSMFSFRDGLETLPQQMEIHLKKNKVEIECGAIVESLRLKQDRDQVVATIRYSDGHVEARDYEQVYISTPTETAATLLRSVGASNALSSKFSDESLDVLDSLEYSTVYTVSMAGDAVEAWQPAFGVLVPSISHPHPRILGISFDSDVFPSHTRSPDESWRICVMMGGDRDREAASLSVEEAESRALCAVREMLPLPSSWKGPRQVVTYLAKNSIAQFRVGHAMRAKRLHEEIADRPDLRGKIMLCSPSVALRQQGVSIPEAIRAAKMAVLDNLHHAKQRIVDVASPIELKPKPAAAARIAA